MMRNNWDNFIEELLNEDESLNKIILPLNKYLKDYLPYMKFYPENYKKIRNQNGGE
jgi:hypothetical protein